MSVTYSLATSSWGDEEIAAMHRVIDSGMYTMGPHVADFELSFAKFMGSRYCVMVNSGSSANLLMIAALRYRKNGALPPGSEVIVPAVSWSTTYFPLYQYGLKLKFVDIDANTLNFDLRQLEDAVSNETRAILAVNLLGNPNDFSAIRRIIGARDIVLLEDNCESMGATFDGRQAGTFGLAGSFSAFFSHHISTMEGGMVVTNDEEMYHIMLAVRAHGWTRNLPKHNQICTKSDDPFDESFRFVLPGYNLRPLELSGAIGLEQLRKLPNMVGVRRSNALHFLDAMSQFPGFRPQKEIGESSWFGFSLVLEPFNELSRRDVVNKFMSQGIEVRPIVAGNFAKNAEALRWMPHSIHGTLRNADEIDERGFFIGNNQFPLHKELDHLSAVLKSLSPR